MRPTGRQERRLMRHHRVRSRVTGTASVPRLAVYRSLNHIYAQVIDDAAGKTLMSASTLQEDVRKKVKHGGNKKAASMIGEIIGKRAVERGIKKVCFDRAGFRYHGAVAALADAARAAGLEF